MKFDWIKEVPDFLNYFNEDHRLIIDLIGFDNYLILYQTYVMDRGIYIPVRQQDYDEHNDRKLLTALIGEENYLKISDHFSGAWIYFSTATMHKIRKAWVIKNSHINYKEASRKVGVAFRTIYKWRQEEQVTK